MTADRNPDFVIRCSHGKRGEAGDVIQRFRWMVGQDSWVATRRSGVTTTNLRGNDRYDWLESGESIAETPLLPGVRPDRDALEIRCRTCPNRVQVSSDAALQDVFNLILVALRKSGDVPEEVKMSLDDLRGALSQRNRLFGRR